MDAGAKWLTYEPITQFADEYGFVQKRLPVYQVQFANADHLAIYVDPVDAAVAAVVRDLDRVEGFSFGYLHKAHWLDMFGKDVRDAVMGLFALLIFAMTCAGLSFLRRERRCCIAAGPILGSGSPHQRCRDPDPQ